MILVCVLFEFSMAKVVKIVPQETTQAKRVFREF